jgi:hypothetical protein
LTVTESQYELEGKVRAVQVIPSVDEAATVDGPLATATYRFWPESPNVACTYTFPLTWSICDGAVVPMPTLPALVMTKFPPAEFEN